MPADLKNPDMNSGKPWSQMDLYDLRSCVGSGGTTAATARFLCRGIDETMAKARELGLHLKETEAPSSR